MLLLQLYLIITIVFHNYNFIALQYALQLRVKSNLVKLQIYLL